jgi:arginase
LKEATMPESVSIIGVPLDLGAGRRGVDMGPSAIRYAGLRERLEDLGLRVNDLGNVPVPLAELCDAPAPGAKLRYLEPIATVCAALADRVALSVETGSVPLVLGGDHSLAIGSVSGSARGRELGLIWIDAHADYNTAETTPSGNVHGMPVAALSGHGHALLTGLSGTTPAIAPAHIVLVGIRDIDTLERAALRQSGITVFTMHEVDRRGMAAVIDEALRIAGSARDGFHLSFDMDAIDPQEAPGVGTPVLGGISYREAHLALEMIAASGRMQSMDMVEVNPILDERNRTAAHAVALAASALGQRIL